MANAGRPGRCRSRWSLCADRLRPGATATGGGMKRKWELSPRFMGRMVLAGYGVLTLAGFDLFYVLKKMVVRTDAAATAANILNHQPLFLAGFAAALLGVAAYLVVTAFLYRLFAPVERTLSLTAALFSLTGCVIQA